ncbi:hypothetical protein H5410_056194 [Solanum commersonii]|uniref:Uncharacterized protein n=1 Tax=Solanum commersonii TaxID=4109 RepID=A0A9J5WLJ6_SOLCO|nr:hypothetical protein H5410_056194 [Solanum commersonii]
MYIVLISPPLCTILGTKIQATLFNKHIEIWKDSLKPNMSYYIAKGRLDRVNPNYYSIYKEVELAFIDNTIIKATDIEVSTHRFSVGFVSLDHVDKLPNGAILVLMNPLIKKQHSKRRGIVVTNEHCCFKFETSFGTLGTFEISTISMSSFLTNPQFQKSTDLVHYINHTYVVQYFTITPSKEMRRAIEVLLVYIMDGLLADSQDCLYKFKTTYLDILNKDEPWYSSCKKCSNKVKVIEYTVSCNNCNSENVEYEMRSDLVSFANNCAHHAAEKIGLLKWLMQ